MSDWLLNLPVLWMAVVVFAAGGPKVCSPKQKGFGSYLIERAFAGQLGGSELRFSPEGVSCTLEVAL